MIRKVNLTDKFAQIREIEQPRIAGEVNDCYVKLVKLRGEFVWHHHENEDEMFFIAEGSLLMKLRDGDVRVGEGEFIVIPRGVEHCPVAEQECHVMLFEPKSTLNTGNVQNERTLPKLESI